MANTPAKIAVANTDDLIRQRLGALSARKEELEKQTAPLRAQRDALHEKQNALITEINAITAKINEIERPELLTLHEEISKMARVLGGKAMSDNVTEVTA